MANLSFSEVRDRCIEIIKTTADIPEELRDALILQISEPHYDAAIPPEFNLKFENSDFEIDAAVASHFLHSGFAAHQQAYAGIYADNSRFDNAAVAILVGDALLPLAHHSGTE